MNFGDKVKKRKRDIILDILSISFSEMSFLPNHFNFWSDSFYFSDSARQSLEILKVESNSSNKDIPLTDFSHFQSLKDLHHDSNDFIELSDKSGGNLSLSLSDYKFSGDKKGQLWTKEEDKNLFDAVSKCKGKNWKKISEFMKTRSSTQCSQRWRRLLQVSKKKAWTFDEDRKLFELIEKHGQNWGFIAKIIQGRTGKQVRERFLNKLDPKILRTKFTEAEDNLIIDGYFEFGSKWKEIAKRLEGRPENMVKNRFYSHIRKHILLKNPEKYALILQKYKIESEKMEEEKFEESVSLKDNFSIEVN